MYWCADLHCVYITNVLQFYKQTKLTEKLTALILLALKEWDMSFM